MTDIGKTDQLIESVIDSGGLSAIDGFGIATVNSEIDATVHDEMYLIERSIDTMLVFMSLFSTIVIFVIFSIENKIESLKQNAILKTLGAENSTLRAVNVSEMLGLILIALFVSLFVSPVFIISSIMVYLIDFGAKLFLFPSPILIATPWSLLLIILVVLVITIVFISYVSVTSESRIGPQTGSFRNSPFESAEWRDA
jgi:predicted lysophospholipase L1 biosynthesis ABC-type transport system permease subunit